MILPVRSDVPELFRDARSSEPDLAVILGDASTLASSLTAAYDFLDQYVAGDRVSLASKSAAR